MIGDWLFKKLSLRKKQKTKRKRKERDNNVNLLKKKIMLVYVTEIMEYMWSNGGILIKTFPF